MLFLYVNFYNLLLDYMKIYNIIGTSSIIRYNALRPYLLGYSYTLHMLSCIVRYSLSMVKTVMFSVTTLCTSGLLIIPGNGRQWKYADRDVPRLSIITPWRLILVEYGCSANQASRDFNLGLFLLLNNLQALLGLFNWLKFAHQVLVVAEPQRDEIKIIF